MRLSPVLATLVLAAAGPAIAGCGSDDAGSESVAPKGSTIDVVATTTQLADFAREVGGDRVQVTQILKPNSDPHDYEPRPDDVQRTAAAKLVLTSGDNLDGWMGEVVEQSGSSAPVVDVGAAVPERRPGESTGPEASEYDPHWWHDPRNAEAAVATIRDAIAEAEPDARAAVTADAAAYTAKLRALDTGIAACVDEVPAARRKLVTDHDAFGYFAARYGIEVVGAVIPSQTTQAQPNAKSIAELATTIKAEGVNAVFPESSINPKLAEAIARQTGASATPVLYGDTLGPEGSPGATYLGMEQANASAMVDGFTGTEAGCRISGL